jgi:hypothetical protein
MLSSPAGIARLSFTSPLPPRRLIGPYRFHYGEEARDIQ